MGQDKAVLNNSKEDRKKSIWSRIFGPWTILILLIVLAAFLYLRGSEDTQEEVSNERPPVAVEIAPVASVTLRDTVRGIGSLRAIQDVEIKPESGGRIKAVHFQEGGYVSKSELLFEIEEVKHIQRLSTSRAALEETLARLENLRRNHERYSRLFESGVISENEFDRVRTEKESAEAQVRRLQAQVELAREELKDTAVRAPFSGFISRRLVEPGSFVTQGQRLATMYQTDPLEISFMVPERYLAGIGSGQEVITAVSAYPDEIFKGQVSFISPSVDESTRNFEVRAHIDNTDNRLRPGSFSSAEVIMGYRENTLVVPERSLVPTRDGYLVFVLDQDTLEVESRDIITGLRRPGMVEIVKGLEQGELVVVAGHMNLSDGFKVRIVEETGTEWAGSGEGPEEDSLDQPGIKAGG
ncbi:MAG: efflux RND transporter periplasmic adaptor subunit [Desulfonatronovibrio sp. MSAO_Bac4]|nr:MAG: efflux RND transporter periplasmic adaptor subunit [Desulfonatronovibrio sp. MSAO_Bac4]